MTRKKQSQLNTQKGFTLVELIVVLVIMVILLSLGIGGILAWQDWSRFKKENTAAETIFYSLQNQFTELDSTGAFDDRVTKAIVGETKYLVESKESSTKKYFNKSTISYEKDSYYKWEPDGSTEGIAIWSNTPEGLSADDKKIYQGDIYCLYAKKGDYDKYLNNETLDDGTKLLFDLIAPYVSETSVLNGAIWVEFSPDSAQVFSVCYSDRTNEFSYMNADRTAVPSSGVTSILDRSEGARRDALMGYYAANSLSIATKGKNKKKIGNIELINDNTLELVITDEASKITRDTHYVISICEGMISGTEKVIDEDALLASLDFTLSDAYGKTSLNWASNNPRIIKTHFYDGAYTDETHDLRIPVYMSSDGTEIHIVLDAADVQAQAFLCADYENPEPEFINTFSFYRFGFDMDALDYIGCTISPDGSKDNVKMSNVETPTFADIRRKDGAKEIDIKNGRHLYNVRFETDFEEERKNTSKRVFTLTDDVDWDVFTGNNPLSENYFLSSYSVGVDSGINYDGKDYFINKDTQTPLDTSNYAFPGFRSLGVNDTFKGIEKSENGRTRYTTISNLTISFAANMKYGVYGKDSFLEWKNNESKVSKYGQYEGMNTVETLTDWNNLYRFDTNTYGEIHPTHAKVQRGLYPLGLFAENSGNIEKLDLNEHKVLGLEKIKIPGQSEPVIIYTNMVGGFAGNNLGSINNVSLRSVQSLGVEDTYSNLDKDGSHVNGKTDVGGIIGRESWNAQGKAIVELSNLKNYANVTGMENIGGIVGRAYLIRDFNFEKYSTNDDKFSYQSRRLLYDDGYDIYGDFSEVGKLRVGTQKSISGRDVVRVENLTISNCINRGEICGDEIIFDENIIIYLYENDAQPYKRNGVTKHRTTYCRDMSNRTHVCANIGGIAGIAMDGIYYDCKNSGEHTTRWGKNADLKNIGLTLSNCNSYTLYTEAELSVLKSKGAMPNDDHIKDLIQHDFCVGGLVGYCKFTNVFECSTSIDPQSTDKNYGKQFVFGRNQVGGLFGCFDFSSVGNITNKAQGYNIVNTNNVIGVMYVGGFSGVAGIGDCKQENLSFRHPSTNSFTQPSQVEGNDDACRINCVKNEGVVLSVKRDALDNGANGIIRRQDINIYKQEYSTGDNPWQEKQTDEYDAAVGGLAGSSRHAFVNSDNIQDARTKIYALSLLGIQANGNNDAEVYQNVTYDKYLAIKDSTIYGGNAVGGLVGICIGQGCINPSGGDSKVSAVIYGSDIVGGVVGGSGFGGNAAKSAKDTSPEYCIIMGRNMVGGYAGINTIGRLSSSIKQPNKVFGNIAVGGAIGEITDGKEINLTGVDSVEVRAKAFAGGFVGIYASNPTVTTTIKNSNVYSTYFSGGFAGGVISSGEIKLNTINVTTDTVKAESTMFAGGFAGFYSSYMKDGKIAGTKNVYSCVKTLVDDMDPGNLTGRDLYSKALVALSGNNSVLYSNKNTDVTITKFNAKTNSCNANAEIGAGGVFGYLPNGLKANIDCTNVDTEELIVSSAEKISPVENLPGDFAYTGGVVGKVPEETTIKNATFKGTIISSSDYIGGICEYNAGALDSCRMNTMTSGLASHKYTGAFAGANKGKIINCNNTMNISGTNAGGIAGISLNGVFKDCSNEGIITGNDTAGGILGTTFDSSTSFAFENCVNTGNTSGTLTAGMVANAKGDVSFELCRNYAKDVQYAFCASSVSSIKIHNSLEAGGKSSDHLYASATATDLARCFYLLGENTADPQGATSSWPVNLKIKNNGSGYNIVFEKGDAACETGITTTVNITGDFDSKALRDSIDESFKNMAKDETNHPSSEFVD